MPTIIDALVVKLSLDSKDLLSKSGAASKKIKEIEGASKSTGGEMKKLGDTAKSSASGVEGLAKSVGGLLALIGGTVAIKLFVSDMIESSAALDRFSKNLGLNAGEVTAWSNATEELGGSAKGLQSSLATLSKAQTDLTITGDSQLLPYFSMMGVSLADAGGKARKTTEILADMASYAEGKDRSTMHNMFASMGFDEGTINLLLLGRKELEISLKRQKEYGEQAAKFAPEATKLQHALVDLKQQFTLLGLGLLQTAAPALEKVLAVFSSLGNWIGANKEFVGDFLKVLGVGLAAVGVALLPIDLAALGVIALAAAIALLWQDYQTWQRGGKSLIDWGQWKTEIDAAKAGILELKKIAIAAFDAIITAAKVGWDAIHGKWGALKSDLAQGTTKMNKAIGLAAAPDEARDQNAKKLDRAVKAIPGALKQIWGQGDTPAAKPQSISDQAKTQAQRVSKMTGIPADILWAQWAHETGNFSNRGAKDLNNLAGVNVPGGHGQDYRKFKTLDEFGDYYAHLMRPSGYYPNASKAKTPDEYAAALKSGGYYSDTQAHYAAGLRKYDNQYLSGIKGASSYLNGIPGATSVVAQAGSRPAASSAADDHSTTVTANIASVNIQTQATDAKGIARDFRRGMDSIFTSYANAGLD